jgi:hypothetical protein
MTAATMAWRPVTSTGGVQYAVLSLPRQRPRRDRPRFSDEALLRKVADHFNAAARFPRKAVLAWFTTEYGNGHPFPERTANRLIRRAKDAAYIPH